MKRKAKKKPENVKRTFALASLFATLAVVDDRVDAEGHKADEVWQLLLAELGSELPEEKRSDVLKTAELMLAILNTQVQHDPR
jgi:hypothetical protein